MNHIFISYSRRDSAAVGIIVEKLREKGLNVWQDISGKGSGIPFSTKWFAAIEEALHNSAGAVVFRSLYWQKSVPCQKEYRLIQNLAIPCYEANAELLLSQQMIDETVDLILLWAQSDVYGNEQNGLRTWLLSSVSAMQNSRGSSAGIPRYRKRKDADDFRQRLQKSSALAEELHYASNMPQLYAGIQSFLKKARRITAWDRIKRPLAIAFAAVMILGSVLANVYYKREKDDADAHIAALKNLDRITDEIRYDELRALTMMAEDTSDYGEYFALLYEKYTDALDTVFPAGFYPAGTAEAQRIQSLPAQTAAEGYTIECSGTLGQIIVHQDAPENTAEETVNLMTSSPVTAYACQNGYLAAACGRDAYLYDLNHGLDLIPLRCCYRDIRDIRFDETGNICAITEAGDVYVWNNPLPAILSTPDQKTIEFMKPVYTSQDASLRVQAEPDGTLVITDQKHDAVIYQCGLIREPVEGVYLDEEKNRIWAKGYSGECYCIDASQILENYDPDDLVSLKNTYDALVHQKSDFLVNELGIAYNWFTAGQ